MVCQSRLIGHKGPLLSEGYEDGRANQTRRNTMYEVVLCEVRNNVIVVEEAMVSILAQIL